MKRKFLLTILALAALYFAVRQLPLLRWISLLHGLGARGMLLAFAGEVILSLLLAPIVPLMIAAGWLYGIPAVLISLPAALLSASAAFLIGRRLKLPKNERIDALARLAAENGIVTVALVRLTPVLPFTPSNAAFGLTPMKLREVVLGTALGMSPCILVYSWMGSLFPAADQIADGASLRNPAIWGLLALGAIAAALMGVAATRRLRQLSAAARRAGRPTARS